MDTEVDIVFNLRLRPLPSTHGDAVDATVAPLHVEIYDPIAVVATTGKLYSLVHLMRDLSFKLSPESLVLIRSLIPLPNYLAGLVRDAGYGEPQMAAKEMPPSPVESVDVVDKVGVTINGMVPAEDGPPMSDTGPSNTVEFIATLTPFKMTVSSLWRRNLEFNLREIGPVLDAHLDRANGQVRFTMLRSICSLAPRVARVAQFVKCGILFSIQPAHAHDQQLLAAHSQFPASRRPIYLLLNIPRDVTFDLLLPILFGRGVYGVLDLVGTMPGGQDEPVCTISDPAKFFASTHDLHAVIQCNADKLE
ncbi:hypothetical protein GGF32_008997 [Allomyces javanicus]|nr:hypothetical protein GGF32_008997 [Allomyces javanicus]